MLYSKLSPEDRTDLRYVAAVNYNKFPGKAGKRKALAGAKESAKAVMVAKCRARGVSSIITMILVGIAVRLVVALIMEWIKRNYLSAPAEYQVNEPGYPLGE